MFSDVNRLFFLLIPSQRVIFVSVRKMVDWMARPYLHPFKVEQPDPRESMAERRLNLSAVEDGEPLPWVGEDDAEDEEDEEGEDEEEGI